MLPRSVLVYGELKRLERELLLLCTIAGAALSHLKIKCPERVGISMIGAPAQSDCFQKAAICGSGLISARIGRWLIVPFAVFAVTVLLFSN